MDIIESMFLQLQSSVSVINQKLVVRKYLLDTKTLKEDVR